MSFIKMSLPLLFSALLTGSLYFIDTQVSYNKRITLGLNLGRQVASQVEILSLNARQRNEIHPLLWAIQLLSISTEPKLIQVSPIEEAPSTDTEIENFHYFPKHGNFWYTKVLEPKTGNGVKVQIHLGFLGFLGTVSPLTNDLSIAGVFILIFFVFYLIIGKKPALGGDGKVSPSKDLGKDSVNDFGKTIEHWADEAQLGLKDLGQNLKKVVQQSQLLAVSAAASKTQIEDLAKKDPTQSVTSALDSYKDIFQITNNLNISITQTTQSILSEVKRLQELKTRVKNQSVS